MQKKTSFLYSCLADKKQNIENVQSHKFFRTKKMYKVLSNAYKKVFYSFCACAWAYWKKKTTTFVKNSRKKTFFSTQKKLNHFAQFLGIVFCFGAHFVPKRSKKLTVNSPPLRRGVYYRSYQAHAQKMNAGEEIYYKEFLPKKTNNIVLGLTSEGITPEPPFFSSGAKRRKIF